MKVRGPDSGVPTYRPRSNGQNLKHLRFHLNLRKQFCYGAG